MRKSRKPLSILLALTLAVAAMAMPALALTQEGNVTAPNTVVNPVFSIGVPKAMTLSLNPLKVGPANTPQISTGIFTIVNNSNVVAAVDVSVLATVAKGVELVTYDEDDSKVPNEAGNTDKIANIQLRYGLAASISDAETTKELALTDFSARKEDSKDLDTTTSYDFSVVLGATKDEYSATAKTYAASKLNGWTAFTFDGDINPNAAWAAKDITLTTVYKATSMSVEAAEASYGLDGANAFDADAAVANEGHQFFAETTWATVARTYCFAATNETAKVTVANFAGFETGATTYKFSTDAAGAKAVASNITYAAGDAGAITIDAKALALKAGTTYTYYLHALDGEGAIIRTIPFYVYITL